MTLESKFKILIESFLRRDDKHIQQSVFGIQNLYNQKSAEEIYTDMIRAQAVLFGGKEDSIRKGIDRLMHESSASDKAHYIAKGMRDSLPSHLCDNETLSGLYDLIGLYGENVERAWECLFSAATFVKDSEQAALDQQVRSFYDRGMRALELGDKDTLNALRREEQNFLNDKPPSFQYGYFVRLIALQSDMDWKELDRQIMFQCGSADAGDKLACLETLITYEDDNCGYGELDENAIQTAEENAKMDRLANFIPPPGLKPC